MTDNNEIVADALGRFANARVSEQALVSLLETNCRRIARSRTPKPALSALLLFKIGDQLFAQNALIRRYLSDSFRLYAPAILKSHPELSGLVYASASNDKAAFSSEAVSLLHRLLGQLARESATVNSRCASRAPGVDSPCSSHPWANTLGDLSNRWFLEAGESDAPFDLLNDLPHFVKSSAR